MKSFLLVIMILIPGMASLAQAPQAFRYQAVARDNSGNVLANQSVSFRISILSGSVAGAAAYSETHTGLTTNAFGLVELEIGKGTPVTGTFSAIDWGSNSYFAKIEMDPEGGTAYQVLSTSQLLSVPYAFHANTVNTGDNWGTQVVVSDETLTGNGIIIKPLGIADDGISTSKINNLAVTNEKLGDGAVTVGKINQSGAASGQVLKWNGSSWAPANDNAGLTLPYYGTASTGESAFRVSNTSTGTGIYGQGPTAVKGESSSLNGHGIYGRNTSTSGTNYGVYGISNSTGGRGVFGGNTAITGANCGVKGESSSNSGFGVLGVALASSGENYGVMGTTYSSSGYGVYGEAYTSGTNYGVYGISLSSTGFGVCGETTSSSGACYGVYGKTSSTTGRGVYGLASSTSGQNFGVRGTSTSTEGIAIYGYASATSGQPFGIIGHTVSPYGTAIFGHTDASSGTAIAVRAESYSSAGYGVHGTAWSTSGKNYGGYFQSASNTGYGVYGTGPKYGIYGVSTGSSAARAIIGEAKGTGSIGVMGLGLTESSTGVWGEGYNYDFYANGPGTNYGSSSSIRWKKNIVSIPDPLETIKAIRGVYFNWDTEHGGQHDIGFIAEEVGKVLPEIVVYEENGIDASGMDYSKITPLLLEAIKELQAKNDLLKQRLDKLETEIGLKAEE